MGTRGNVALNLINVYRALGGGWEIRTRKDDRGTAPTASTWPQVPPARGREQSSATRPETDPK